MKLRLSILASLIAITACGEKRSNSGLPPLPQALSTENIPDEISGSSKQGDWNLVVNGLGLTNTVTDLPLILTNSDYQTKWTTLVTNIGGVHVQNAPKTRCASVTAAVDLGTAKTIDPKTAAVSDFSSAKLYMLKYKLQTDVNGTADEKDRHGYLVVPTTAVSDATKAYPIISYAHGGDSGLGYAEIAAVFGQYQGNHIIVAPSYPGEPVCSGSVTVGKGCAEGEELAASAYTASVYDNDADELLGMQHCIARASLGTNGGLGNIPIVSTSGTATGVLNDAGFQAKFLRHSGTAQLPKSILVGTSRGGLVSDIALAKTGAALSIYGSTSMTQTEKDALLGANYFPSQYSCSATLMAPTTWTAGYGKLILEQIVRGTISNTAFIGVPSVAGLVKALAPHMETIGTDPNPAMIAIGQRDALINTPLIDAALRNWATDGKGARLFIHGVKDKVVNVSHSIFAAAFWTAALPKLTTYGPGFSIEAGFVNPPADLLGSDGNLVSPYLGHGMEAAFVSATAVAPAAVNAAIPTEVTPDSLLGKTPQEIFAAWRTGTCQL